MQPLLPSQAFCEHACLSLLGCSQQLTRLSCLPCAARLASLQERDEEEEALPPKRSPFGTRKLKASVADEVEEEAAAPRRGSLLMGRKEGLATMAERRYAQQQGSRGTGSRGTGTQARGSRDGTGTTARKSREEIAAARAAARAAAEEERRQAREATAAAKAAAEEERRARQAQL